MDGAALSPDTLRRKVEELEWYHTLELAPGVFTPGWFDTRDVIGKIPFPASLQGKRCLDVGTFDGYWAFEMERRGSTDVLAIDVLDPRQWDWPVNSSETAIAAVGARKGRGEGFEIAKSSLGSKVERLERNVYDLDPAEVGEFDFVYFGSLLLHLRDPVRALERARSVCKGEILIVDAVSPLLTSVFRRRALAELDASGRPWWWKPNLPGLVRMVEAAGFALARSPVRLNMPAGPGQNRPKLSPRTILRGSLREQARAAYLGDPHAAVLARPTTPA